MRFPGIVADARALGVNYRTLERVRSGEWTSKILSARFKQLKEEALTTSEILLINDYNRRAQIRKASAEPRPAD